MTVFMRTCRQKWNLHRCTWHYSS